MQVWSMGRGFPPPNLDEAFTLNSELLSELTSLIAEQFHANDDKV